VILKVGLIGGLRMVARSWGLLGLLLAVSLCLTSVLAIPLSEALQRDLDHRDAAASMMYGFDYPWWSHWSSLQAGFLKAFGPEIFGSGFAPRNWDLALRGELPRRMFGRENGGLELDGVIAGVGVLYLLVQTFLAGGILTVFRAPQGHWNVRSLLHGSGFYFGRFLRLGLLVLLVDAAVFTLNAPFARLVDRLALEASSERTGLLLSFGRYLLLAFSLLFVHMVGSYAKVIIVLEERTSAFLGLLSALSFCLGRIARTAGHYALVVLLGAGLLAVWSFGDSSLGATGYKTQLLVFGWAQLLIVGRLALRLALMGGQMEIYRHSTSPR
jgi:hypothetical protein